MYLMGGREGTFGLFDFTTKLLDGTVVFTEILSFLLLVQLDEVLHHTLIEILTTCLTKSNKPIKLKKKQLFLSFR